MHLSVEKKRMHEARIKNMFCLFVCLKQRLCSVFWYILCSDIQTTEYSGGHDIKNAASGWQLKKHLSEVLSTLLCCAFVWQNDSSCFMLDLGSHCTKCKHELGNLQPNKTKRI